MDVLAIKEVVRTTYSARFFHEIYPASSQISREVRSCIVLPPFDVFLFFSSSLLTERSGKRGTKEGREKKRERRIGRENERNGEGRKRRRERERTGSRAAGKAGRKPSSSSLQFLYRDHTRTFALIEPFQYRHHFIKITE